MSQPAIWDVLRRAVAAHDLQPSAAPGGVAAGVLVPVLPYPTEPHVLLTVRSYEVEHHKGQISFPGGMADASDPDLLFTALRETHEEMGILPDHVEVLGQLTPVPTPTGFRITPYVGLLDRAPYAYTTSDIEVAEVLEIPLSHLLDLANAEENTVNLETGVTIRRSYRFGEHLVFGATAFILRSFLEDIAAQLGVPH